TLASPWGKADALHVRRTPPLIPPGSRYRYSNLGYQIVGHVLERATGTPIHELLLERILGPLGMTRSTGAITDEDRLDASVGYEPVVADRVPHGESPLGPAIWQPSNTADGSIISTAPDLCAYARMILAQGRGLLAPEAFARWTAAYVESDEPDSPYGYGWGVTRRDGRRVLWHTGGTVGFTAILEIRPDDGLAVAICQNGGGEKGALAAFALAAVEAALRGTEPPPPPEPLRPAADAAGTYAGPDRTFRIEETAAGAVVHAGPLAVPLQPLGTDPDELVGAHPALDRYPVRVLREDGRVVGLAHGPARYTAAGGEAMPAAEDPPAWAGLTGLYRSDSPWTRALRVYPREGRLYLLEIANGEESELIASEGDRFAVGDAGLPDRVRFLDPIGGAAQTLDYDGASFTRSFET
ncbi:MAG TPA: serine hydrolase domain-containing protein, partial [Actinomycetota bacterium]|nr:serine hydrolase domain-containing protein [Actinomycetota bacterium]